MKATRQQSTRQLTADELSEELPVFVFGTLRPGWGNACQWDGLGEAKHDGKAIVKDHRLVSNGAFPYCLPAAGRNTVGTLIVAHDGCWSRMIDQMDMLEGVPVHYNRRRVNVSTPEGKIQSWYYLPDDWGTYERMSPVPNNDWAQHRLNPNHFRSSW